MDNQNTNRQWRTQQETRKKRHEQQWIFVISLPPPRNALHYHHPPPAATSYCEQIKHCTRRTVNTTLSDMDNTIREKNQTLPSSIMIPLLHARLRPSGMLRGHSLLLSGCGTAVVSRRIVRRAGGRACVSWLASGLLPVHIPTGVRRVCVVR